MIGLIVGILLTIIDFVISITLLSSCAFLMRITLIDSIFTAIVGATALYLCNRAFDISLFSVQIPLVICLLVGVTLFITVFFLQKTTPGFWIFALIFSVLWSFLAALVISLFITESKPVFWIVFAVSFLLNIGSHIRSRDAEFRLN